MGQLLTPRSGWCTQCREARGTHIPPLTDDGKLTFRTKEERDVRRSHFDEGMRYYRERADEFEYCAEAYHPRGSGPWQEAREMRRTANEMEGNMKAMDGAEIDPGKEVMFIGAEWWAA